MEKLLEKEFPLLTTVKVIGLLVARPISTYTEKKIEQIVKDGAFPNYVASHGVGRGLPNVYFSIESLAT